MLKEKKNSWNALNDSTSQSSDEEQISKTNLSNEQPIYIFPPNMDYPEDDLHEFYFPSDFPKHSHLQMVCSYFRLGPPYGLLTTSLEHYKHQKNYPDQRPRVNNLKNDRGFMNLLAKYADFYLDYDLQDPDNKASKQYLFIDPRTKRVTKRKPPLSTINKTNLSQRPSTKIILKAHPHPTKIPSGLHFQQEVSNTTNNFPALSTKKNVSNSPAPSNRSNVKPTKSASGPHYSNYGDMNNMEKTRTKETSLTTDPCQDLKKGYSRMDEKLSEMLDILKSLR